jgi:hypothetical protein
MDRRGTAGRRLAKVNELIQDPPRGSVYVIHPELVASGFQPADVKLPDSLDALGGDWDGNRAAVREFQVRNYLQLRVRSGQSATAAAGWQGDHYDVYVDGDESVATFRLRFATESDVQEFVEAQRTGWKRPVPAPTPRATQPSGRRMTAM